jgi:hypothetical protein
MAAAPEVLFHRYFQGLSPRLRAIYRGKHDLDLVERPLQDVLRAIQTNLIEALRNERRDVREHVPHPPFHVDFIDSDHANAMAFTEGEYSFIGLTVALIRRIYEICLRLSQAGDVATLLGLQLDSAERTTGFHALLFRLQLNFVTTHEYTHHVHGHTVGSTIDSRFANEIDSGAADCDIETQVSEIDADIYGMYHVLSNLFGDERAFAIELLNLQDAPADRRDKVLLACVVLAVGTFLFVRPTMVPTLENCYRLCHPPQAARMDFIVRIAVQWCRNNNQQELADWMTPEVFERIMNAGASVTAGADAAQRWAQQTIFLQSEDGKTYLGTLRNELNGYIAAL